ncbi:uncharacterized protein LOC113326248 [Papaver somniferum]|uniref:uncharacterized protein LOC113326248 n=1 Tax=Papaver somniferum TaxID=3469 RepID=UPI000E70534B|nr:uncharacterized protein LOC113326248 [Papaver somniferum]
MMHCSSWDIKHICGYKNVGWTSQQSVGSSGGMLTIWDRDYVEVSDSLVGDYSLSILCTIKIDNFQWVLTNVYGPDNPVDRTDFWIELDNVCRYWTNTSWCIAGDFNTITKCAEKKNCRKITRSMTKFNEFILEHDLIDLPLKGARYTWSDGTPSSVLWQKLQALKEKLKVWNKDVFGHTKTKLNAILSDIQALDGFAEDNTLTEEERSVQLQNKIEFEKISKMEETSWRIKSNIKWMQEGDRNTSFFISNASARRRYNRIQQLYIGNELVSDRGRLQDHIVEYYKTLFIEEEMVRPLLEGIEFDTITYTESTILESDFSEERFFKLSKI